MKLSKLSPKAQNLIGCGALLLLILAGVVGYAGWKIYSFFSEISAYSAPLEIPGELREPRVLKGADFLSKTGIFKLEKENFGAIVKKGAAAADEKEKQKIINSHTAKGIFGFDDVKVCGGEIVAAGKFGAQVFDLNGNFKREILFEPSLLKIKMGWYQQNQYRLALDNLQIVDLDGDGKCEFFSFGYLDGVTVYAGDGNIIWKYGGEETADVFREERDMETEVYVTQATVGDLDGDRIAEYIVGRANDGIRVFDKNGNEKWFQPDNYPGDTMRVLDLDGDARNELLEVGSIVKVRDAATGNIISESKAGSYNDWLLFTEDKNKKKILQFCDVEESRLKCVDEAGTKFIETEAPLSRVRVKKPESEQAQEKVKSTPVDLGNGIAAAPVGESFGGSSGSGESERVYKPKAVWVALRKDKPKYLAVVASFISLPRAHFYVYAPDGTLVYHELLPEDADTIATIPANLSEEIVIGGKETIWKFAPR